MATLNCYSAPFPTYQRAMRIISAITNTAAPTVTTTLNHQYATGDIVRFNIPPLFGMEQLDQQLATVTVVTDTTFTIDIDTTFFAPFVVPGTLPVHYTGPQVIPVGEVNSTLQSATQNVLPYSG